ncbi:mpv17-like protein 2 [Bradysia coprophila]|uniref:mpv17-like protein 2 n=1 Tax=Bradysia coprophila TaxID=38358 RepID=UPI00187D8945|nr:mpv17-like protein 2 [Bradysia coprophila]
MNFLQKTITKCYSSRSFSLKQRNNVDKMTNLLFGKYLLATNTLSSGLLMVVGDLISQEIEFRTGTLTERYNWKRSGNMFIVGAVRGPLLHYFYGWLDKTIKVVTLPNVTKKIILDQTIMSPITILAFFYPAGWLEGQSTGTINSELKDKITKTYAMDWCVWPPAQFLNFYYIDPKFRVIYVNFVTIVYNICLSYIKYET